jgi:hypothetical protein
LRMAISFHNAENRASVGNSRKRVSRMNLK